MDYMDEWKLGEGNPDGDEGEFSIGNTSKEKDFNTKDKAGKVDKNGFEDFKSDFRMKKQKSDRNNSSNQTSKVRKIFYAVILLLVIFCVYYLIHILFLRNKTNIKIFNLKERIFKSNTLHENNLVITGYLVNKNKFPIGFVKLTARLYSSKNITLVTKHIYAGNFASIKKLKNMDNTRINAMLLNKSGVNMSDIKILPNHPIRVMAVFFDIPLNSKNYSITVKHFYRITK